MTTAADIARVMSAIAPVVAVAAVLILVLALVDVASRLVRIEGDRVRLIGSPGYEDRPPPMPTLLYIAVPLLTLVLVATVAALLQVAGAQAEITLPLLLSGGVVLLLLGLTATAVVFRELRLTDSQEALGLPKGSVRAVIALLLILIFAIMTIHLYSRTGVPQIVVLQGLTQAEVDQIPVLERRSVTATPTQDAAGVVRFNVERAVARTAADDLAKQVITTVSTLVVAISAFYFGSNSVQTAHAALGSETAARISARSSASRLRRHETGWEPIDVTVTTVPSGLEIRAELSGDDAGTLGRRGESNLYVYKPNEPKGIVRLRFEIVAHPETSTEVLLDTSEDAPSA